MGDESRHEERVTSTIVLVPVEYFSYGTRYLYRRLLDPKLDTNSILRNRYRYE